MFKKPKNVENLIQIWGWMDDVVVSTKKGKALSHWKKYGIPLGIDGENYRFDNKRKVTYANIVCNRFWYKDLFARQLKFNGDGYRRIYAVFAETMAMP